MWSPACLACLLGLAAPAPQRLAGPGANARIIPHSDRIPAEELPLEHRGGAGLTLPAVFSVSRNVTAQVKHAFTHLRNSFSSNI